MCVSQNQNLLTHTSWTSSLSTKSFANLLHPGACEARTSIWHRWWLARVLRPQHNTLGDILSLTHNSNIVKLRRPCSVKIDLNVLCPRVSSINKRVDVDTPMMACFKASRGVPFPEMPSVPPQQGTSPGEQSGGTPLTNRSVNPNVAAAEDGGHHWACRANFQSGLPVFSPGLVSL